MIPRLKPALGWEELRSLIGGHKGAVQRFEQTFADMFGARSAVAFPYGRSALWALFRALGIEGAEVIIPAYTCVVVAHATVLSNNTPRFVDITLDDYNMDLDQVEAAISARTRAIIATHLFGYPLDVERLKRIVAAAETRYGQKIWVVQDCAHSFGTRWRGRLVCNDGDAALFGLNISKMITSILGGMITTNDPILLQKLRSFRDEHFVRPRLLKSVRRLLYLLAAYPAFYEHVYGGVLWLEERTPLLDPFTKAYHLDNQIHFPPDYLDLMLDLEANVGLVQLRKYPEIVRRRRENATFYDTQLRNTTGIQLPPLVDGATYSHYVVRAADRGALLAACHAEGVQLGTLIQYSIPETPPYRRYKGSDSFPNSRYASKNMLNLPVHAGVRMSTLAQVVATLSSQSSCG